MSLGWTRVSKTIFYADGDVRLTRLKRTDSDTVVRQEEGPLEPKIIISPGAYYGLSIIPPAEEYNSIASDNMTLSEGEAFVNDVTEVISYVQAAFGTERYMA